MAGAAAGVVAGIAAAEVGLVGLGLAAVALGSLGQQTGSGGDSGGGVGAKFGDNPGGADGGHDFGAPSTEELKVADQEGDQ